MEHHKPHTGRQGKQKQLFVERILRTPIEFVGINECLRKEAKVLGL